MQVSGITAVQETRRCPAGIFPCPVRQGHGGEREVDLDKLEFPVRQEGLLCNREDVETRKGGGS